jgi:aspartokinase-like uncharacterized kinase
MENHLSAKAEFLKPRPQGLVRVVKVGGSLFDYGDLVAALRAWLAEQSPAVNVLLAGGGPWAESVREADARWGLGEETSHWLCIEAMRVTARLLVALLPESPLVTTLAELRDSLARQASAASFVFCPSDFLRRDESAVPGVPLPANWSVTSDSIAARLAQALGACELVLLKSADPPAEGCTGYVDAWFATASRGVTAVRIVNLRKVVQYSLRVE